MTLLRGGKFELSTMSTARRRQKQVILRQIPEFQSLHTWPYQFFFKSDLKKRLMGISNVMSPTWALLQHLKSLQKW